MAELIRAGMIKPADIIAAINQRPDLSAGYEGPNKAAVAKELQRDIQRLRSLGQHFAYDRTCGGYVEQPNNVPLVTVCLNDEELTVLAQLRDIHRFTPFREAAASLYDKIAKTLDETARRKLSRAPTIQMSLPVLDELSQHMATAHMIERATQEERDLIFQYQMAGHEHPYDMRVQVLSPLELRDGHVYFEAYSLKSDVERTFRLSRVVPGSAKLYAKRPSRTRHATAVRLQYWLSNAVEPTKHFPKNFVVKEQDDGVIVSALIDERELFRAAKILLRYGHNCIVLEPPALVDDVRRNVEEMAKHYGLLE